MCDLEVCIGLRLKKIIIFLLCNSIKSFITVVFNKNNQEKFIDIQLKFLAIYKMCEYLKVYKFDGFF